MRLVAGVLALALFAPLARAQDTTAPEPARSPRASEDAIRHKLPLRLVRVMPESRQALLFDRARATHVLAEVGGKLDGYTVEDIDDDTVTLSRDDQQIVLVAPPRGARRRDREDVPVRSAAARRPETGAPTTGGPAPIDPYGDDALPTIGPSAGERAPAASAPAELAEAGIRVAHAPSEPASRPIVAGEGGIRVAEAPGAAAPAGPAPIRAADRPAAAPAAMAGEAAPPAPVPPGAAAPTGDARTVRPAEADATAPAAPAATAAANSPEARAAARASDQQTLDARALANAMTAGPAAPSPRPPAAGAPAAARTAEVHPVTAAPASPEDARSAGAIVISRGELDRALADFAGLTAAVRGSFSASGVTIEAVGDRTIFQRAGLRAGDVITAIDGVRLRSLDDAADLYARASAADAITAQVVRGGKPVTLHVVIR